MTDETRSMEPTPLESLTAIRSEADALVSGTAEPYAAGRHIQFTAMAASGGDSLDGEHCWALWLLWGALTDWVEQKPGERPKAEEAMRRAAKEWLELPDGEPAWRRYFDYWLYSELGLERPKDAPAAPSRQ
jgi:hypothetical protein